MALQTWHLYEQGRPLELMDPDLESTCLKEEVFRLIEVALLCTQAVPTMRPSMSRVVAMLTSDAEVIPAAWGDSADHLAYRGRAEEPARQRAM
jgi:hypothetical protein